MRNLSRGLQIFGAILLAGGAGALPEPKGETVLHYQEQPGRLTRDRASQPYRPTSQRGKSAEQWLDWMGGNSLRAFWRHERRAGLPPAVDIWHGTPEEAVVRLIDRDRAGRPGERPPVVLPAEWELPEKGHLRFEYLLSSCSAPFREEAILRWEPAGAWIVLANSEAPDPGSALPAKAEPVDLAEARRLATLCLLLARARFEAAAPPAVPDENRQRFIGLSSEYVTVTIRSDDRSVAEQIGHRLPDEALDEPWRQGWTPEFAAYLGRRVLGRLFTQLRENAAAAATVPRSRAELRSRNREQTVATVRRMLEFAERCPELAMPMQLQQALAAVLENDLLELLPAVGPLANGLPPLFGWEKHVQSLKAEIAALERELEKHQLPGLAKEIKETPMNNEVNVDGLRARFPGFVAEPLGRLQKARLELKQASPFYAILPYQIERDWQDLRETVGAILRRQAVGESAMELRRWAEEEVAWSEWAYRRLKVRDPKAAAALVESRLLDPKFANESWFVVDQLQELEVLAPQRLPAVLARLSPETQKKYRARVGADESPDAEEKSLAERVAAAVRRQKVGSGTCFRLEPLAPAEFLRALRELEAPQVPAEERAKRMKQLAVHVPTQADPLRARFTRLLPKLDRVDRLDVILLGDLREQRSYLLEHATSSPDDFAPDGEDGNENEITKSLRLHQARWIVSIWDESDAATRAALVVAFDLHRRLSGGHSEIHRWRLQELFRAALSDQPAAERDLVAARLHELSTLIISRHMPASFEADWQAAMSLLSGPAADLGNR